MTKPTVRIHNAETNEIIDREMTDAEFAQWQSAQETEAQRVINEIAKAAQRQAILDRLGLTNDEAALLLS